jgi:hypothetical protein
LTLARRSIVFGGHHGAAAIIGLPHHRVVVAHLLQITAGEYNCHHTKNASEVNSLTAQNMPVFRGVSDWRIGQSLGGDAAKRPAGVAENVF